MSRDEGDMLIERISDEYGWKLIHSDVFRIWFNNERLT
jgi:hypothetical protein